AGPGSEAPSPLGPDGTGRIERLDPVRRLRLRNPDRRKQTHSNQSETSDTLHHSILRFLASGTPQMPHQPCRDASASLLVRLAHHAAHIHEAMNGALATLIVDRDAGSLQGLGVFRSLIP